MPSNPHAFFPLLRSPWSTVLGNLFVGTAKQSTSSGINGNTKALVAMAYTNHTSVTLITGQLAGARGAFKSIFFLTNQIER